MASTGFGTMRSLAWISLGLVGTSIVLHRFALWPAGSEEYTICVVPAIVHVSFEDACADLQSAGDQIQIHAMQQEYESVQVLVRGSESFTVDLESTLPLPFRWYQVGFVYTKANKRVGDSGGGWRPDPLLAVPDDVPTVRVPAAFTQPLWLTLHVNVSSAAQLTGEVRLRFTSVSGRSAVLTLQAAVRVAGFAVPSVSEAAVRHLWGFSESNLHHLYGNKSRAAAVSQRFHELLLRNRIPAAGGSEKLGESPLVQIRLDMAAIPENCTGGEVNQSLLAEAISKAQTQVARLRALGWPEGALYGYGRDEPPEACAGLLREAYSAFREAVPGLKLIAAVNWRSELLPPDFPLDAWVHLYHQYREEDAALWTAAGKEYWGYHCIEPAEAGYMNIFIERPLIEARLLFWLAASQRYQGWLYWATDLWRDCNHSKGFLTPGNSSHPALLAFDPANYIWCPRLPEIFVNGDGYYTYPGPTGPVSSQRLEVIRDGLEDWELFRRLQPNAPWSPYRAAIANFTAQLVHSPRFTPRPGDPSRLEAIRSEAIEAAGGGRFPSGLAALQV